MVGALIAMAVAAAAAIPMTAPGPKGPLAGTFLDAGKGAPVVVIIPGSGPTDRDGNNPMGVTAAPYRLLAEALATEGVSSLRADKRGLFGSKAAVADPNAVTIGDYATDAHQWAKVLREKTGAKCIWLLGHSEGVLVALKAAQEPQGLCGVVLVSGPGRRLSDVIRDQLRANPANAPVLDSAMAALDALDRGEHVDTTSMNAALLPLFRPAVQDYLIDNFRLDPAKLAASLTVPVLIVQGERDIQISADADAKALAKAQPRAKLVLVAADEPRPQGRGERRSGGKPRDLCRPVAAGRQRRRRCHRRLRQGASLIRRFSPAPQPPI